MDNNDDYLEYITIEKLRYALRIKKLNEELLDQLSSSLRWLIHYSEKHNFPLPEQEKLLDLIKKSIISNKMPKSFSPNFTPKWNTRRFNRTQIFIHCRFKSQFYSL